MVASKVGLFPKKINPRTQSLSAYSIYFELPVLSPSLSLFKVFEFSMKPCTVEREREREREKKHQHMSSDQGLLVICCIEGMKYTTQLYGLIP